MNYDLTNKEERKRYVRYTNMLLREQRSNVKVVDESNRTPKQNSYIHVLCRILAVEVGVTEHYAKYVYLKKNACPEIFISATKDKITGKMEEVVRSTKDLTIPEMRKAIMRLREWASNELDCYLPDATIKDDGTVEFKSEKDKIAYHQAEITTSKLDTYI